MSGRLSRTILGGKTRASGLAAKTSLRGDQKVEERKSDSELRPDVLKLVKARWSASCRREGKRAYGISPPNWRRKAS
jgi:hypothetical protein